MDHDITMFTWRRAFSAVSAALAIGGVAPAGALAVTAGGLQVMAVRALGPQLGCVKDLRDTPDGTKFLFNVTDRAALPEARAVARRRGVEAVTRFRVIAPRYSWQKRQMIYKRLTPHIGHGYSILFAQWANPRTCGWIRIYVLDQTPEKIAWAEGQAQRYGADRIKVTVPSPDDWVPS